MDSQIDEVIDAFTKSPEYRLSIDTWFSEVIRGGIVIEPDSKFDETHFTELISGIVRQLVLVGFCVIDIKNLKVKSRTTITWDVQRRSWSAGAEDDTTICIVSPPVAIGNGDGLTLTSFGAAALPIYKHFDGLIKHSQKRDAFNSMPSLYTTPNPNIGNGDIVRPAFITTRGPGGVDQPDHTTVGRRYELLENLMERSRELRTFSRTPLVTGGGFPEAKETVHNEFLVTDGQVMATEARHLQAPVGDFNRLFSKLRQMLLQTLGVPPQTLGENVNSERLAGSAAISNQALRLHAQRVAYYRDQINKTLEEYGCTIRPFVQESDVIKYALLFRADVHRELFASALGIPPQFLIEDTRYISQQIDGPKAITERGDPADQGVRDDEPKVCERPDGTTYGTTGTCRKGTRKRTRDEE